MPDTWATSGIDLHLDLTGRRVRAGLEAALRDAVRTGRLRPATRLPSSRALASDLGIARNTVAEAYGQLVAEGWLTARRGSGTQVADRAAEASARQRGRRRSRPAALRPAARARQTCPRSRGRNGSPRRAGRCSPRRPRRSATVTRAAGRNCAASWPATCPGPAACAPTPDRIVICSGFTQGLGLLCQALRAWGAAALAVEAYGLQAHRRRGGRPRAAPGAAACRRRGRCGRRARRRRRRAADPGAPVPARGGAGARRRTGGASGPRRTGGLIIEDDYDGEFRYDRQPVGALQALAPEHVVYAGTASKSLAPGPPAGLAGPAGAPGGRRDRGQERWPAGITSSLDQLTLAEFIESGALRPAGAPLPARLPAAAGPAGRRAAPTRAAGAGHRHRGRPARAAASCRPASGRRT